MALVFNPFTGNFDNVIASSSEMSMSDGTLTVNGDINLDDGGAFSTTVQAVTPTQDRTISFPDATGTVALVNGANGTIQYNDAGTLKGNSDFTVDPDWNDASTVFTGLKLNVTDTASAAGSNLLDLQVGGTSKAVIDADGKLGLGISSPTDKLEIQGNFRLVGVTDYIKFGNDLVAIKRSANIMEFRGYSGFIFYDTLNTTERARIDSSGNLGIATSTPDDKLEIGGAGAGIILASPDGTRYRLTVANGGTLSIAAV
jgi:hypothetical protein